MAIIERIGLPPLRLIRDSSIGNDCFSTSTGFVLKAGVYGDANARIDDRDLESNDEETEPVPKPEILPVATVKCMFCNKVVKNERCLKNHLANIHGAQKYFCPSARWGARKVEKV